MQTPALPGRSIAVTTVGLAAFQSFTIVDVSCPTGCRILQLDRNSSSRPASKRNSLDMSAAGSIPLLPLSGRRSSAARPVCTLSPMHGHPGHPTPRSGPCSNPHGCAAQLLMFTPGATTPRRKSTSSCKPGFAGEMRTAWHQVPPLDLAARAAAGASPAGAAGASVAMSACITGGNLNIRLCSVACTDCLWEDLAHLSIHYKGSKTNSNGVLHYRGAALQPLQPLHNLGRRRRQSACRRGTLLAPAFPLCELFSHTITCPPSFDAVPRTALTRTTRSDKPPWKLLTCTTPCNTGFPNLGTFLPCALNTPWHCCRSRPGTRTTIPTHRPARRQLATLAAAVLRKSPPRPAARRGRRRCPLWTS